MANGVPKQKHHYNISWVLFAIVIAGCIVAYLYWKYQVPVNRAYRAGQEPVPEVIETPTGESLEGADIGTEIFQGVTNPLKDALPDTGASVPVNPLKDAYKNPFE
ncbi:MAG: hypothetical protein AAB634_01370 [Patescibacteria group bacterium]